MKINFSLLVVTTALLFIPEPSFGIERTMKGFSEAIKNVANKSAEIGEKIKAMKSHTAQLKKKASSLSGEYRSLKFAGKIKEAAKQKAEYMYAYSSILQNNKTLLYEIVYVFRDIQADLKGIEKLISDTFRNDLNPKAVKARKKVDVIYSNLNNITSQISRELLLDVAKMSKYNPEVKAIMHSADMNLTLLKRHVEDSQTDLDNGVSQAQGIKLLQRVARKREFINSYLRLFTFMQDDLDRASKELLIAARSMAVEIAPLGLGFELNQEGLKNTIDEYRKEMDEFKRNRDLLFDDVIPQTRNERNGTGAFKNF